MNGSKECSQRSNELVLDKFDELTLIAKQEMKQACEWLKKKAEKAKSRKKDIELKN